MVTPMTFTICKAKSPLEAVNTILAGGGETEIIPSFPRYGRYVDPLWENYNCTLSRVPMTDWYFTVTSNQRGFQHRTVVGGHFIKLLEYSGKMKQW